jgi:uncharacterized membrane protein
MLTYVLLKYVHVIGAAVLLGTGAGIAFFMLLAHRTGDAAVIAAVARMVVLPTSFSRREPLSFNRLLGCYLPGT